MQTTLVNLHTGPPHPIPQGVRQGQRRQLALSSANSYKELPNCNETPPSPHRPGNDGRGGHRLRRVDGKRFQAAVLEYQLGGATSPVLAMSVSEARGVLAAGEARRPRRPRSSTAHRRRRSATVRWPAADDASGGDGGAQAGHADGQAG